MEINREKAWDQKYVTDWKWWTQLVSNVDSVRTNRVHHFRFILTESTISGPRRSFDPRPSPDFSPWLRDKIREWERASISERSF